MKSNLEILEVGADFIPGPKSNIEIAAMLKLTEQPAPDFCNRSDISAEYMEFENRVPYVKPTLDRRHVCIFDHKGGVCVTKSFKKGSQALACALHFVLSESKSVMS